MKTLPLFQPPLQIFPRSFLPLPIFPIYTKSFTSIVFDIDPRFRRSLFFKQKHRAKSKVGSPIYPIFDSTVPTFRKIGLDLEQTNDGERPPSRLTTFLPPPSWWRGSKEKKLGRPRPPRRRWLQKQAITTNLIAGARQKKALEGGWLGSRGEYVPPSRLPNK